MNLGKFKEYVDIKYGEKLSKEEMKKKYEEYYKTKDSKLREELIVRNYELVPYAAWKISLRHGIDIDDVVGYGYEGLIHAIDTFNPNLGNSFSTYAVPCIMGYIKKYLPELVGVSKNDNGLYYQFNVARRIVEKEWDSKYDHPEMLEDILDLFIKKNGYSEKQKDFYRRLFSIRMSLDELADDAPELVLDYDLDVVATYGALHGILEDAIKQVCETEEEIEIIKYAFGFDGGRPKTLDEVGFKFRKTRERVRQIEGIIIRKLHSYLRDKGVREILDVGSFSEQDLYTNDRTR